MRVIYNSFQGRRQLREIGGAKVFADFQRLFLAEILTFFSSQKQVISNSDRDHKFSGQSRVISKKKKKICRNAKAFSDGNHKFQRFFRPKKATFSSQKNTVGQEINRGGGGGGQK